MSAILHVAKRSALWLAGALFLFAVLLLGLMRTAPGHATIEWVIAKASGGEVIVTGLQGKLPNHLRADRIELRDSAGSWLRADGVMLDWRALPALWNRIVVSRISAVRIEVLRRPQPSGKPAGSTPRIDIDSISLPVIALSVPVAGRPAVLTAAGSFHYASLHDLSADMTVTRSGHADRYSARGSILHDVANGRVAIAEGADGLLGGLIGLPGLSPVHVLASAQGDISDNRMTIALQAGKLSAQGQGRISLANRRASIAFDAQAPAMELAPAIGWTSLTAKGQFDGSFDAPDVKMDVELADLSADGYAAAKAVVAITGAKGRIDADGRLEKLRLPGQEPELFAQAPVIIKANANLAAADRPVQITLHHPIVRLEGTAHTRGAVALESQLVVPSLSPLAPVLGGDIAGSATGALKATYEGGKTSLDLQGDVQTQGPSLPARLLGHTALKAHAVLSGNDIQESQVSLDGTGLAARIDGSLRGGRLDYRSSVTLKDIARLTSAVRGEAMLSGRITGPVQQAIIDASGRADLGAKGGKLERMTITLHAAGLPPTSADFTARGTFGKAPLQIQARLSSQAKARRIEIKGDWKSLGLRAQAGLPDKGPITGQGAIAVGSLKDFAPFTGAPIEGALRLTARLTSPGDKTALAWTLRANKLAVPSAALGLVTADGVVTDVFGRAGLSAEVAASAFAAQGWSGQAQAKLSGSLNALTVAANAKLLDPQAAPADLALQSVLDVPGQAAVLRSLTVGWRKESLVLAAPAKVRFAPGVSIDGLRLAAAGGAIKLSGQIAPKLDVSVSAQDIRAEVISLFLPQVSISGTLSATADLNGALAAPHGLVTLRGRDLRNRVYAVTGASTADVQARAVLDGKAATVDATLTAGKSARLVLSGKAPLAADGALDLRLAGNADLGLLDPILAAGGQRMRGLIQIDTVISGSPLAPHIRGSANLGNGEFQDFARGIRLREIAASLKAGRDGIHLVSMTARAGDGTITGSGELDAWSSGMPVDIVLRADNARPIASDLLTAVLSGSARLSGKLQGGMTLKGSVTVPRAEVTLPQSFPPQVRTLNVRRDTQVAPGPVSPSASLLLDLTITATGPVILRGRGIDADLGGNLDLRGPVQVPNVGGGFQMRRGTLTLAGQVLNFTSGKITFNGTGVRGRLDPALDFVASETSGGVTATLTVAGYASRPKITLSSSPQLPQDEVLARLLFQQSAKQLGPLQLAEGAQALASMAGIGSGFSPLATLRGGLGLDRLSVGSGSSPGSGASVEAGKYVSRNVYIGAKQSVSGQTQAQVQIDLTKNLKAQATVRAGTSATATQGATAAVDNGNSVGLSYQFDY